MKNRFTILFALLCVSVMSWADTQYCETPIADGKILYTCAKVDATTYTVILAGTSSATITGCNNCNWGINDINGTPGGSALSFEHSSAGYGSLTATFTCSSTPNKPYVAYSAIATSAGQIEINECPKDMDWTATCGGGSTPPATKYAITVTQPAAGGTIGADVEEAAAGATVHLTATPALGKALDEWIVTAGSDPVTVTNNQFTMPASAVTVTATFKDHDPNEYTAGGHTIHLEAYYVGDLYTLIITSADDMTGLGGSFWFVDGVAKDMRTNNSTLSYVVSGDKKTITCSAQSSSAPTFDNNLYILFPGEINFGKPTLNWEDRTPVNSEYCNYQGAETHQDDHYFAITFETDASGNVVITIGDGAGAGACSFRNGGFEGGNNGLDNFVVSDDDFVTSTPATDYFTVTRPTDGDLQYVMTKTADLPANAKIKHLSTGAIAWREAGADRWCFPEFIYTYGGTCNQLDAPTNVAVDADSIITFDAVTGADAYTAYVSLGGVEKYHQAVTSGGVLHFWPYEDGAYKVTVIASGAGKTDSDPSDEYTWNLSARAVVLDNSEYCEHVMSSGNTQAAFTWETDGSGNIVITISETLGGAADATHFRGNALALGNFKVGASQAAGSNYFTHPGTTTGNQLVLTATTAPAPGEKIYYNGTVEYATSLDGNAWPTLQFEWTYGTVCSGIAVSATPNNNTMGTAVVQKAGVDVTNVESGDEVSFIATSANAELYRFVNWTKGGVEVSTSATYVTTITETTNLIANFDYIRNPYCHTEVTSVQGKKFYLTLAATSNANEYMIRFDGSAEARMTGLNNANFAINNVCRGETCGNDIRFTHENDTWVFNPAGYGSVQLIFTVQEGKTWKDIYAWDHYMYVACDGLAEQNLTDVFPARHHIAWNETCADAEAPVFVKAQGAVIDATSVRLKIQASDNWEGMLQYTIARADAEPIISNHASGEEFTQDVTGLTTGTEYDFTVTVSDGVNNASTHILVTPVADNTKPYNVDASLVSKTWNAAVISVAADDDFDAEITKFRVVNETPAINLVYEASEGKITVTDLVANTDYNFTITALDAAGNESELGASVAFKTLLDAPNAACANPTLPSNQVKAVYSPTYGVDCNFGYWDSGTAYTQEAYGKKFVTTGTGYFGLEFINHLNCINMEKLHLDIWIAENASIGIVPIWGGGDVRAYADLTGQQWNSIDLELSTDYAGVTNWSDVYQLKIDNAANLTFWIANVYFYRESAYVDTEAPTAFTASLAEESYFSVKINAQASDNSGAVIFTVKNGDDVVATQNAASAAATVINVTGLNAGTAYNLNVYVADEAGNTIDPIAVAATTKALPAAAPTPVVYDKTVVPVFSDAIAGGLTNIGLPYWGQVSASSFKDLTSEDKVFFSQNFNFQGWDGFHINATGMEYLHVDVYTRDINSINITPISAGHEGVYNVALTANAWTSIDVPLSVYDANNINWADIFQFKFFGATPEGKDIFIDNVYFYKFREPDYTRAVTEGKYGTICLPKAGVMTGAMIFEVAYLDNSVKKIFFDEVLNGEMVAGRPYIFLPNENVAQLGVFYTDDAEVAADNYRGLFGSYTQEVLSTDGTNYILLNNQYCRVVNANTSVGANRAYFKIGVTGGVPTNAVAPMPGRRRVGLGAQNTEVITNIDNLNAGDQPVKVMIDGQLYILRGEKMYNANGQIVK